MAIREQYLPIVDFQIDKPPILNYQEHNLTPEVIDDLITDVLCLGGCKACTVDEKVVFSLYDIDKWSIRKIMKEECIRTECIDLLFWACEEMETDYKIQIYINPRKNKHWRITIVFDQETDKYTISFHANYNPKDPKEQQEEEADEEDEDDEVEDQEPEEGKKD